MIEQHTLGPWYVPGPASVTVWAAGPTRPDGARTDTLVCEVMHPERGDSYLIAAAPAMFAACELALRILDRDGFQALRGLAWTDGERDRIAAAVALAKPPAD